MKGRADNISESNENHTHSYFRTTPPPPSVISVIILITYPDLSRFASLIVERGGDWVRRVPFAVRTRSAGGD